MIEKISRGWGIGGLIRYLMGPTRSEELVNTHVDQRVVASWDHAPHLHRPPAIVGRDGEFDVTDLVARLLEPAKVWGTSLAKPAPDARGKVPQGPVWHCSVRNHVSDRVLSDQEWSVVVADVMDRTGIAAHGDPGGCRWVAIRHAQDHVHIAAVLVRQDSGRRVYPFRDWPAVRAVCQEAEIRLDVTRTEKSDRTAVGQSSRAETEKAARRGMGEAPREFLRRAVRIAAVQAQDPEGFRRAVEDMGVRYAPRMSDAGQLLGYSVAARGDVNAAGLPVWFSGGALGRDLTAPALLARWSSAPARTTAIPPSPVECSKIGRAEREGAVAEAICAVEHAGAALASGAVEEAAGIAHACEDMLNAVTAVTQETFPPVTRGTAADVYQRAARAPGIGQPLRWGPVAVELRRASWRLCAVRSLVGSTGGEAGMGQLLAALALLLAEIAAYHEQRQCLVQARAARASREVLGARPPGHPAQEAGPGRDQRPARKPAGQARTPAQTPRATPAPVVASVRRPGQSSSRRRGRHR